MRKNLLILLLSCLFINTLSAQNLLVNGNFESGGNGVGFNINGAGYTLITAPFSGTTNAGNYAFTTNPQPMNTAFFIAGGDHTTGTGNMMVIDGNGTGGSQRFWRAGNTGGGVCNLIVGATYTFSYWIKSVSNNGTQAALGIQFTNVSTSALTIGSLTAPLSTAGWQKVTHTFVPNNTCVNIELWNNNTDLAGNDFAVDDFSVASPLTVTASIVTPSCPGVNDGSLTVYGDGGVQPYLSYSIAGPVSQTNGTGVFTGLAPGPYSVSVTDSNGVTTSQPGFVIGQATNLTTSFNNTICIGSSTTLSASGGTTYLWTASPLDPTLTTPTSATPTVSPVVTTTYTVTSPAVLVKNLVYNGNFTLGNRGFSTDYQFLTASTTVGIQGAYGIVTNPSAWFAPFSTCGDHTSGAGNMMVVDGSVSNSGNDKLWGQTIPVTPAQNYTFSYWVQTIATPNPATLETLINGSSLGIGVAPTVTTCGNWTQYSYVWNSGASTTAQIAIFDRLTTSAGNDFAIDDISFTTSVSCLLSRNVVINPVAPPTATISGTTSICPGNTTVLSFTGTPGASVLFTANTTGLFYTVILNASGNGTFTTPPIAQTTIFNLVSSNSNPAGCQSTLTGSATVSININGCATVLTGGVAVGTLIDPICNVGETRNLSSSFIDLGTTTTYLVEPIPYCPQAAFNDPSYTQFPLNADDTYSPIFNLPFNFCFYGNSFSNVQIGDNGVISFGTNYITNVFGQNAYVHATTPLSNINFPGSGAADSPFRNMILGVYQDTNTGVNVTPAIKSVNYAIVGTYPCRKLIVNFSSLGQFSCNTSVGLQTSQIVLYEISNIIEVYVQNRTPCNSHQSGRGTIGIKGGGANPPSLAAPGRDSSNWSATNEAWRFKPNGPSAVTFQWLEGTTPISTNLNITVAPTTTTTYTAEASYNVCGVITKVTKDVTVEVYADLTQTPTNIVQCPNVFNLTQNTATVLGTLNASNYVITYHLNSADATNATNQIVNPTAFTSTGQTIYMSIQGPGGCNLVKQFDLVISCVVCETITNPSASQTLCVNGDPSALTVTTSYTGTNSISYVYFTTPQTGSNMYSGGTLLGNVTPVSGTAVFDPIALGAGSLPNAAGTYYVYAIANPIPADATCRPFQLIEVVVNQLPNAGTDGGTTICGTSTTPIVLADLITGEQTGGTWSQASGSGGLFDAAAGTFTPTAGATTSTFTYLVNGLPPCGTDSSIATVTIAAQLDAGTGSTITICSNNSTIDLATLVIGEQPGGVWTQTSGTGGTFNPTLGTFTPVAGATDSTFNYTLTGVTPCVDDFSTVTIIINQQTNAGTDGNTTVCDSNATPIVLANLITGEQIGGTWLQTSGTGGTFDAAAGTFIPTPGTSLTNTFQYTVTGVLPCVDDVSVATITVNPQPNAGTDGSIAVCDSSTATIVLSSLITGEQTGGTWTQTSGTGGTFNATAGTFTPAVGTSVTNTFQYTLAGTAPCIDDFSIATITVNPQPLAGTDGSAIVCDSNTTPISLASLITGEQTGGVWTQTSGTGGTFIAATGTFTPTAGTSVTNTFQYTLTGTAPCIDDFSVVTITVNQQPNAGTDGSTTVCDSNIASIDLATLITGEQTGGTWVRTSGTGGNFNAAAGTFTPAVGASVTSTFEYTLTATAPCTNDVSIATVTVNPQPTAGTDGSTTICETSTAVIVLSNLITGEQTGGTWARTGGLGGNFDPIAGTFTPAVGATSSTFSYTLTASAPCTTDVSTASVNINAQPNAGTDGATTVCESSTDLIILSDLITGEQAGGSWTRTSGSGGNFNAVAGTFTPGFGATLSTFTYTISGSAPCVNDDSVVTITFTSAPFITNPTPFVVCDDTLNNDGIFCFNLQTKNAEITTDPTVTITYHYTLDDSEIGANALPTTFCNNIPGTQIIYVRVFNPLAPACPSLTTLTLQVNPLPLPNPVITDYNLCDVNNSGDGIEQFDLSTKTAEISNGQTNVTITYYESEANAIALNNPLPNLYSNTSSPFLQEIWINIAFNTTGCSSVSSFNLVVNPLPLSTQPGYPQYELCDTNQTQIGFEQFDLSTQIDDVLLGQLGMQVQFYPSYDDAEDNLNEITNLLYTNVQQYVQTLGVRITNSTTGCFVISSLDLVVNPLPTPVTPTQPYVVCDTNTDGVSTFDLSTLTPGILGGETYTVTYHVTPEDAAINANPITANPYTNNQPFVQMLYVRVEDAKGCFTVITVELNVNPSPIVPTATVVPDLVECDNDTNTQDGSTRFNLEQQTPLIIGAQTPPTTNYTVDYYTSSSDATLDQNEIITTTNYLGTNGQTIWYAIRNGSTDCFAIGSFNLVVNAPIVLTSPTLLQVCDNDAAPNDQFTTFNLAGFIGPIPNHTIVFYPTLANAIAETNPILTPNAFQNTQPANQTVWYVATNNTTLCKSRRSLTIRVLPVPTPKKDPPALAPKCDVNNPGDGIEVFDLTTNAAYIQNNDPNVTLLYFATLAHAQAGTPQIATPNAAPVSGDVYIRVQSNLFTDTNNQNCYIIVVQQLKVNPIPTMNLAITDYQECDDDTDGFTEFNLSSKDLEVLGAAQLPADYTVSYYLSAANAQAGTGALNPAVYINTFNPQTIYVRVQNNATGCFVSGSDFDILVNPKPIANTPADYFACDYDTTNANGFVVYDLNALVPAILGTTQTLADYDVTFHTSQANADAGTNAIANTTAYVANTQTIYIRVKNKTTNCYRTTFFNIVVEPLPQPVITTPNGVNVICVDFNTDIVVRDLTLTATNTVPGTYTYEWFEIGNPTTAIFTGPAYTVDTSAPNGATRTYYVVMTSANGCFKRSDDFQVIQSGQAVIVGATGYTITNAFESNQTITVNIDGYGAGSYEYSLDDGPRQTSNVFENVNLGTALGTFSHTITVWDTKGGIQFSCDPLIIGNVQTIDYPHYFTPNGDGIHDTWNIVGLSGQQNAKIYIFDRFGKLIKQISPKGEGWDGTYNGQLLPATDYWFSVDYLEQTTEKQFKAHFALKR